MFLLLRELVSKIHLDGLSWSPGTLYSWRRINRRPFTCSLNPVPKFGMSKSHSTAVFTQGVSTSSAGKAKCCQTLRLTFGCGLSQAPQLTRTTIQPLPQRTGGGSEHLEGHFSEEHRRLQKILVSRQWKSCFEWLKGCEADLCGLRGCKMDLGRSCGATRAANGPCVSSQRILTQHRRGPIAGRLNARQWASHHLEENQS